MTSMEVIKKALKSSLSSRYLRILSELIIYSEFRLNKNIILLLVFGTQFKITEKTF